MSFNSNHYVHPDDKAALQALKAIPGFTTLMKTFMKEWSEKQIQLRCLSSYVRLGEDQLPRYKEMLKPICEKLGIAVPELYLMMDVRPNAFTAGENDPHIVITSGLLEILPEELIPTVLAHECGHIACHHVLYRTMGTILFGTLSGTLRAVPLGPIFTLPLQMAYYHWMRCSEFSADRAAVLCDGSGDKMAEVCLRLAGFDQKIAGEMNMDAFLKQAQEYRKIVEESGASKSMEGLMLMNASHPFAALRALECFEWTKTEQFSEIMAGTYVPKEEPQEDPVQRTLFDIDNFFKSLDPKNARKEEKEVAGLVCPKCGTKNREGSAFCMKCGASLKPVKKVCPQCGEQLHGDEAFCPKCGTKVE